MQCQEQSKWHIYVASYVQTTIGAEGWPETGDLLQIYLRSVVIPEIVYRGGILIVKPKRGSFKITKPLLCIENLQSDSTFCIFHPLASYYTLNNSILKYFKCLILQHQYNHYTVNFLTGCVSYSTLNIAYVWEGLAHHAS